MLEVDGSRPGEDDQRLGEVVKIIPTTVELNAADRIEIDATNRCGLPDDSDMDLQSVLLCLNAYLDPLDREYIIDSISELSDIPTLQQYLQNNLTAGKYTQTGADQILQLCDPDKITAYNSFVAQINRQLPQVRSFNEESIQTTLLLAQQMLQLIKAPIRVEPTVVLPPAPQPQPTEKP